MRHFPLKKGVIHVGIIAAVIVGLAIIVSVKIFADQQGQRPFDTFNRLCQLGQALKNFCPDADRDGFSNRIEEWVGTDTNAACAKEGKAAYPPDLNNDGRVDQADVDLVSAQIKSGLFDRRFDLNGDKVINVTDRTLVVSAMNQTAGQSCDASAQGQDSDNDGFNDSLEGAIGTDKNSACPVDTSHNAFPPDLNNDGRVDQADVDIMSAKIKSGGQDRRFDLNADGTINVTDRTIVVSWKVRTNSQPCTPATQSTSSPSPSSQSSPTPSPTASPSPTTTPTPTPFTKPGANF